MNIQNRIIVIYQNIKEKKIIPWIGIVTLLIGLITLLINIKTFQVNILSRNKPLIITNPQEILDENHSNPEIPPNQNGITLVTKDYVTCGHIVRIENESNYPKHISEISVLASYGIYEDQFRMETSKGASWYKGSDLNLPEAISQVSLLILPDEYWEVDPDYSYWENKLDLPLRIEANSTIDIRIGIQFYFEEGFPQIYEDSDYDLLNPLEWSNSVTYLIVPFSAVYEFVQSDGVSIPSPEYQCFNAIYSKLRD